MHGGGAPAPANGVGAGGRWRRSYASWTTAALPAAAGPSVPGGSGPIAPAIPATPGAPLSPAALGQGFSPGPMGQSVATGMMTGQPATAGVQSLSDGAMHAMGPGSAPLPQAPPPLAMPPAVSAPALGGGESFTAAHVPVDTPAPGVSATPTGGGVPVTPALLTGGPVSAPAAPAAGPASCRAVAGLRFRPTSTRRRGASHAHGSLGRRSRARRSHRLRQHLRRRGARWFRRSSGQRP